MSKGFTKAFSYVSAALAGILLSVSPSLLIRGYPAAMAAGSYVGVAEKGPDNYPPVGDIGATAEEAAAAALSVPSRRIPMRDAELARIKALPGAPASQEDRVAEAVAGSGPPPGAVDAGCVTNFNLAFATTITHPDIHGAVSSSRMVNVSNLGVGLFGRPTSSSSCQVLHRLSLKSFFAGFPGISNQILFDPQAIYDFHSRRFFVSAVSRSRDIVNSEQFQYFAVSKSAAPGDLTSTHWNRYRIQIARAASGGCNLGSDSTSFLDYPGAGVNNRRWFIAINETPDPITDRVPSSAVISIDKAPTLTGADAGFKCFVSDAAAQRLPFNLRPPIQRDTGTDAFFLSAGSGGGGLIARLKLSTPGLIGTDTLLATPNIKITVWTAPPDARQPNLQKLDTLDGRFQSSTIQIGTALWQVHAVNVSGQSRWRLYKLSTTGTTPLFTFTPVFQAGTHHNFNPSVATGSSANGALAFVGYSQTRPASSSGRAAMKIARGSNSSIALWSSFLAATSPGQYTNDGFGNSCNSSPRGSCSWGKYSSTQMDPAAPATRSFHFNQLISTGVAGGAGSQFNWFTRAAHAD